MNGFAQKAGKSRHAAQSQTAIIIQTIQDLQNISLSGNYQLACPSAPNNSIDASATAQWNAGVGFLPIGTDATPFTGTLNGNGCIIAGLYINSALTNVGLFGTVGSGGVVENTSLTGANITSTGGGTGAGGGNTNFGGTGALVGHLSGGQVINCTVQGTVAGNLVGGLVGLSGDLVGSSNGGTITNSNASVAVTTSGGYNWAGGLVGGNLGTISNSIATGSVTNSSEPSFEGGLVGVNESSGTITNCEVSATVTDTAILTGGFYDGVGGLVAFNLGTISQSHATGPVSGSNQSNIGGLVGINETNAGAGDIGPGLIQQCVATGAVTGGPDGEVGGLVGFNFVGATVEESLATGTVTSTGSGSDLGGLTGLNEGVITQSYATGPVSSQSSAAIGGLVGDNTQATNSPAPQISQSFSTGLVQDATAGCAGGLVGCDQSSPASSSYWDELTSSLSSSATGTGETTAQLQSGTLPAGFDSTVWAAESGLYPYLIWLGPAPITGYVDPKYVVMGVTYAPPGPSGSTFVQYQNSSLVGNSQSVSQSFMNSNMASVDLQYGLNVPVVGDAQITATYSATVSQTIKTTSTVTTMFQVQQGEKTFGTGNYFAPVDHDYDVIWVWLNPAAIFTLYGSSFVAWNGYGSDAGDQPDADIVGIELGYLNGDFGPMPPQYQAPLARAWAMGQIFPPGQGPALTSAELAQIASADPFSVSSYGPDNIGPSPPSPETPDHRFTLSSCNGTGGFAYNQGPPSSSPEVYSCTLTYTDTSIQAQDITSTFSETFSLDAKFSNIFSSGLTAELKDSETLAWTTEYQQSVTKTTTSTSALSVQGPPCGNATGQTTCSPVYDASGNQPVKFDVYQDNMFGTFMFAPVGYYTSSPTAILSSATLTFASQLVGTSSAGQSVQLVNPGSAALSISDVTTTGDFSQTNECGNSVAAGASCTIMVTFTPTATGARKGVLTINDNSNDTNGSTQTLTLTGTGAAPSVSLGTTSVSFGDQSLGTTSAASPITVSNNGTAALTFTNIAATGDFMLASSGTTCSTSSTVAAGTSCAINLTFTPTAAGALSGTLTITDNNNGVSDSTQTVNLTGTGTGPAAVVSPAALPFTPLLVKSTSSSQAITLSNPGTVALTVASIAITGNFAQTNNCGTSLAAGGSCTVSVTFTPLTGGPLKGTLTVTDNSNDATGSTQTVLLSGTGQSFAIAAASGSATSQTVTPGGTANYKLSFTPQGGLSGQLAFSCSGAPSGATCTVSPNPLTLNGNGTTTATVSVATTAPSFVWPLDVTILLGQHRVGGLPLPIWWLWGTLAGLLAIWRRLKGKVLPLQAWRRVHAAILVAVLLVLAGLSCHGGNDNTFTSNQGTPPGTSTVAVTATYASGSGMLTQMIDLILTVN